MKVKNYSIQTLDGKQIYTNRNRKFSTVQSESCRHKFESIEPNDRLIAYWSKLVGEPVKAVEAGYTEVFDLHVKQNLY